MKPKIEKLFKSIRTVRSFFEYRSITMLGEFQAEFIEGGRTDFSDDDDGTETFTVYKFTDRKTKEVVFVRFDGIFTSSEGLQADSWDFVVPKEVTVIQFVKE